jgi:hypothetical protein
MQSVFFLNGSDGVKVVGGTPRARKNGVQAEARVKFSSVELRFVPNKSLHDSPVVDPRPRRNGLQAGVRGSGCELLGCVPLRVDGD